MLARGTFQRDSLRGGERFPRASSNLPRLLSRGVTFLGKLQTLEASGLLRVLVGVWTLLMTIHPVRDAGVSMTFLTASVAVSPPSEVSTWPCLSRPALLS